MFICSRCQRDVSTEGLFCPFCGAPAPQGGGEPGDPYVGQTVAQKYFVHQLLGSGGMGQVYKATHLTLDRPVVLKMLNRALSADPSIVQRFHREARAASRLNHPNSINVIDFGQAEDGTLFIAMEYLAGRSLAKVIVEDFPLDPARVVKIGSQILAALTEAHAVGILHRDLKPENVMVESRRDDSDFVKVLDFGIAQLTEGSGGGGSRPRLTQAGMVCGTPGYMSPEQARGEELDARSDLYSVGIILYEMLTGRLPFDGETPQALVAKVMMDRPIPPGLRRPELQIPPDLTELVMSALAPERDERPASAEDFRRELLACALAEPRPARATPNPQHSTLVLEAGGVAAATRGRAGGASKPGTPPRGRGSPEGRAGAQASSDPRARAKASSDPRAKAKASSDPRARAKASSDPRADAKVSSDPRAAARTPSSARATPRPAQRGATPRPGQRGPTPRPLARPLEADDDEEDELGEPPPPPPPERTSRLPLVLGSLAAAAVLAAVAAYAIYGAAERPAPAVQRGASAASAGTSTAAPAQQGAAPGAGEPGAASGAGRTGAVSGAGEPGAVSGTGEPGAVSGTGEPGTVSGAGVSGAGEPGAASGAGQSGTASGAGEPGTASGAGEPGTASGAGQSGAAARGPDSPGAPASSGEPAQAATSTAQHGARDPQDSDLPSSRQGGAKPDPDKVLAAGGDDPERRAPAAEPPDDDDRPVARSPGRSSGRAPEGSSGRSQDRDPRNKPAPRRSVTILEVGEALNSIATPPVSSGEGVLAVDATPWAHISINGRDLGDTPCEARVSAGTYRVLATHPELGTTERTIEIAPGTRERWIFSLAR
jgi:serine/threonine-protein kinase